jgi:plastocyanin
MKLTASAVLLALAGALALPGAALAQDAMQDPNAIPIQGNQFMPPEKMVGVGTTVTWVNMDAEDHDVLTNDLTITSPVVKPGESWSFTFDTPGTYNYLCDLHNNMTGVITVTSDAPAATETDPGQATG